MPDTHVLLYTASSRMEANLHAETLEANGITVNLAGGGSVLLFGVLGAAEALHTELWVKREDYDRARAILEQLHEMGKADLGPDGWKCRECGQENDPGLGACWSCQAART